MIERFLMRIFRPLLRILLHKHADLITQTESGFGLVRSELDGIRQAQDGQLILLEERHEFLISQFQRVQAAISDLWKIADLYPRLSLEILQAWEAVSFACEKYDRDREQHATVRREEEVIAWARIYLGENSWPDPGDAELRTLIFLRNEIDQRRTVGKHS